ncbi:MAG: galactokinase [Planctomycetota bacterium]|nr:galactokinase [Planctomycetota bacterium]
MNAPARARAAFERAFARPPEVIGSAPGRVNLIGEHIDYCGGPVLPIAIDARCAACVGPPGEPGFLRVLAADSGEMLRVPADLSPESLALAAPAWRPYVLGTLAELHAEVRGIAPEGPDANHACDIAFAGDVPLGAGLSSSAALEVSVATACAACRRLSIEPVRLALLCQRAEHRYAGVPCGIMDQAASVFGRAGHAMRIACDRVQMGDASAISYVPAPDPASCALLVVNTGVRHALADGAYADRRAACETAARALGVRVLCDAPSGPQTDAAILAMPDTIRRAARHVLSERDRVDGFIRALAARDWPALGAIMLASHASLRDDYRVSCDELDAVVDAAREHPGVYGARLTGAGFGGSAVVLARRDAADNARAHIASRFAARFGRACTVTEVRASDGARASAPPNAG